MKVIKKQLNSHMCIICGIENGAGLKAPFYEMENQTVVTKFKYAEIHQSYPERCHGGMISCMLDELIGRAIWISEPNTWGVTTDLHVRFIKPVPLNTELFGISMITINKHFTFSAKGIILDQNGQLLAEASGNYFKLKPEKICDDNIHEVMFQIPDNFSELAIPDEWFKQLKE